AENPVDDKRQNLSHCAHAYPHSFSRHPCLYNDEGHLQSWQQPLMMNWILIANRYRSNFSPRANKSYRQARGNECAILSSSFDPKHQIFSHLKHMTLFLLPKFLVFGCLKWHSPLQLWLFVNYLYE